MKDAIELAKQAGFQKFLKPEDRPEMICDPAALERFATLVRNAALTEAIDKARIFSLGLPIAQTERLIKAIGSLKEPTP